MTSCWSSRKAVSLTQTSQRLEVSDTLREQVIVAVFDTITITKTITIRENENGDTLRMTTVTDRERIRSMSDVRSKKEDVYVRTDTVYIEREAEKTVAVAGPNTEIDEQGNVTKKVNRVAQTLKWLFLTLVAIIAIIILIRIKLRR